MTCKYCMVGYWVATFLAIGAFLFCFSLTEFYGWQLSNWCWFLKGIMLSIGLVLGVGLFMVDKRPHYLSAWVLALLGVIISGWQTFFTDAVCTLDCGRPIFMLGDVAFTPLVTSFTLFAILLVMMTTMILRNRR